MKPCPAQASSTWVALRASALADIPVLPGLQSLPSEREWRTCWQSLPSGWKGKNLFLSEHETKNATCPQQRVPGLMWVSVHSPSPGKSTVAAKHVQPEASSGTEHIWTLKPD